MIRLLDLMLRVHLFDLKEIRDVLDKLYHVHNIDMSKDCDLPYLLTLRAQSWSLLLTLSDSLANVVFGERL